MRRTFPNSLVVIALVVTGCSGVPGLSTGQTLRGKVMGTGLGSATKVAVMAGYDKSAADVVSVGPDGSWNYAIPAGRDSLTIFAFQDTNGNSKVDSGEPNSYERSSCPNCSYLVATLVGDTWRVQSKLSTTISDADVANANIKFDA